MDKITNPSPFASGVSDFINLSTTILSAPDALSVVNQAVKMNQANMETFFYLAQMFYQTEVDYLALDPAIISECDPNYGIDYCVSTCFQAYV
jgi:hypothetical protein